MIPNVLSWLIFTPLIGAAAILFTKRDDARTQWIIALATGTIALTLSILALPHFDVSTPEMQFVESRPWIAALNISYHLGVDGISLPMILVTTLLTLVSLIASRGITLRTKEYFFWFLILEAGAIGLFAALDLFVFYVFWELVLVPMYFLIGIWGGPRREYAAIKFFVYTLVGSILMLLGVIAVYLASSADAATRTLDLVALTKLATAGQLHLAGAAAVAVFLSFYLAFAIKVPAFPFHTWLPLAHVEAPTPVSVILAGVLLKMGLYGLLRICYPVFPEMTRLFLPALLVIAVINIVYGALCALAQTDMKRMVAYSSVSHMGLCLLGISAVMGNPNAAHAGLSGAVFQMVSHGLITGSLFLLVGVIYDRAHTRDIDAFGGLAGRVPVFAGLMLVQAMASLGLPGLAGFISEFLCFLGGFGGGFADHNFKIGVGIAVIGIFITAAFFLRMIKLVLMGPFNTKWEGKMPDMTARELITVVPLVALTLALGVFPSAALQMMDSTVGNLIRLVSGQS